MSFQNRTSLHRVYQESEKKKWKGKLYDEE